MLKIVKENTQKNGVSENNIYIINKEKTIPVNDLLKIIKLDGKILFDEEITIFEDGIYQDNKIRIIIEDSENYVNVFSADFEEQCGLAYWIVNFHKKEFEKFKSIEEFIDDVFIKGFYSNKGISIATGMKKEDILNNQNEVEFNL